MTEAKVYQMPIRSRLVCSVCGASGEGSCRCGAPYLSPGERASEVIKNNPEKSDRTIAEETGVSRSTVVHTRKKMTGQNGPAGVRIGRDGKNYRPPQRRTVSKEQLNLAAKAKAAGKTHQQAAEDAGLGSAQSVKIAVAYDEGRRDVLEEIQVDPGTLSLSARAKLEIAKRQIARQLQSEYNTKLRAIDEEVRRRVLAEGKDYIAMAKAREKEAYDTAEFNRRYINDHKPPFTSDQFKAILMCLHPDGQRSHNKLTEAFRLFNGRKLQLTGET